MKTIRTAIASAITVAALALSSHAYAQSVPIPYTLTGDPAIPDITTKQQQDEVMKLFTAHLGLWFTRNLDSYPYEKLVTEDAEFEYPYARSESARVIDGRDAIAQAVRALPLKASDWKFSDVKLFQTAYPDVFFVSYKATAHVAGSDRPYEQTYLARIKVKNGQIANYHELWDRSVAEPTTATASRN